MSLVKGVYELTQGFANRNVDSLIYGITGLVAGGAAGAGSALLGESNKVVEFFTSDVGVDMNNIVTAFEKAIKIKDTSDMGQNNTWGETWRKSVLAGLAMNFAVSALDSQAIDQINAESLFANIGGQVEGHADWMQDVSDYKMLTKAVNEAKEQLKKNWTLEKKTSLQEILGSMENQKAPSYFDLIRPEEPQKKKIREIFSKYKDMSLQFHQEGPVCKKITIKSSDQSLSFDVIGEIVSKVQKNVSVASGGENTWTVKAGKEGMFFINSTLKFFKERAQSWVADSQTKSTNGEWQFHERSQALRLSKMCSFYFGNGEYYD